MSTAAAPRKAPESLQQVRAMFGPVVAAQAEDRRLKLKATAVVLAVVVFAVVLTVVRHLLDAKLAAPIPAPKPGSGYVGLGHEVAHAVNHGKHLLGQAVSWAVSLSLAAAAAIATYTVGENHAQDSTAVTQHEADSQALALADAEFGWRPRHHAPHPAGRVDTWDRWLPTVVADGQALAFCVVRWTISGGVWQQQPDCPVVGRCEPDADGALMGELQTRAQVNAEALSLKAERVWTAGLEVAAAHQVQAERVAERAAEARRMAGKLRGEPQPVL